MSDPDYIVKLLKSNPSVSRIYLYKHLHNEIVSGKLSPDKLSIGDLFLDWCKFLFPDKEFHSWREMILRDFALGLRGEGKVEGKRWEREYCLHGSSNSNKTSSLAMAVVGIYLLHTESVTIHIGSPQKQATKIGIWSEIQKMYLDVCDKHESLTQHLIPASLRIQHRDARHPKSFIQVSTSEKVGGMVGQKPEDMEDGYFIMIFDEACEFSDRNTEAIIEVMDNLISITNLLCVFIGNFKKTSDLLGLVSRPSRIGGYHTLEIDKDQEWLTSNGGKCQRLDGHRSPNVLLGYDKYKFCTTIHYLDLLRKRHDGEDTVGYNRFARSFPILDMSSYKIVPMNLIKRFDAERLAVRANNETRVVGFLDPGFGGDECIVGRIEVFEELLPDGSREQVVSVPDIFEVIPVKSNLKDDEGNAITMDQQIVSYVNDYYDKHGCEYMGYDPSLRSTLTLEMERAGRGYIAYENSGPASDRIIGTYTNRKYRRPGHNERGHEQTAKDAYYNVNAEQAFDIRDLLRDRRLVNMGMDKLMLSELTDIEYLTTEGIKEKKKRETKKQYRKRNGDKSCNRADVYIGCIRCAKHKGVLYFADDKKGSGLDLKKFHEMTQNLYSSRVTGGNSLRRFAK